MNALSGCSVTVDGIERHFTSGVAALADRNEILQDISGPPVPAKAASWDQVMNVEARAFRANSAILTRVVIAFSRAARLFLPVGTIGIDSPAAEMRMLFGMLAAICVSTCERAERLSLTSLFGIFRGDLEGTIAARARAHGSWNTARVIGNATFSFGDRGAMFGRMRLGNSGSHCCVARETTKLVVPSPAVWIQSTAACHTGIRAHLARRVGAGAGAITTALRGPQVFTQDLEISRAVSTFSGDGGAGRHIPFYLGYGV